MKLSAVILTKNEENHIATAIESVKFCEEILVFDDHSTDKTVEIAKELGAILIPYPIAADFSAARNEGMKSAKNHWILFLDTDEEITPQLQASIEKVLRTAPAFCAYWLRRQEVFWRTILRHGEVRTAYAKGIIRLVKKDGGAWQGKVHEVFVPSGKTKTLKGYITHISHQNIAEFLAHINQYSTLRARELVSQGKHFSLLQLLLYPPIKFFYTYFGKLGFLDGPAGFVYSFLMAFHSFLVRAKLYQYTKIDNP